MKKLNGLSLVEAIISNFIMALSILSITGLKLSQANATQSQLQFYNAWQLLEYKLTDLRRLTHNDSEFSALGNNLGGMMVSGDVQQDQFSYQLNWQVVDITDNTLPLVVRKVTVTVSWFDINNEKLVISDSTLLSVLTNDNN